MPTKKQPHFNFKVRPCICGKPEQCGGMTTAFALFHDPRGQYMQVPPTKHDVGNENLVQAYHLRQSFVRHLNNEQVPNGKAYIALHHFHPQLVLQSARMLPATTIDKKGRRINQPPPLVLPRTISQTTAEALGMLSNKDDDMILSDADQVLDANGQPTGAYYVVPHYSALEVQRDLQRLVQERKTRKNTAAGDNETHSSALTTERNNTKTPVVAKAVAEKSETTKKAATKNSDGLYIYIKTKDEKPGSESSIVEATKNSRPKMSRTLSTSKLPAKIDPHMAQLLSKFDQFRKQEQETMSDTKQQEAVTDNDTKPPAVPIVQTNSETKVPYSIKVKTSASASVNTMAVASVVASSSTNVNTLAASSINAKTPASSAANSINAKTPVSSAANSITAKTPVSSAANSIIAKTPASSAASSVNDTKDEIQSVKSKSIIDGPPPLQRQSSQGSIWSFSANNTHAADRSVQSSTVNDDSIYTNDEYTPQAYPREIVKTAGIPPQEKGISSADESVVPATKEADNESTQSSMYDSSAKEDEKSTGSNNQTYKYSYPFRTPEKQYDRQLQRDDSVASSIMHTELSPAESDVIGPLLMLNNSRDDDDVASPLNLAATGLDNSDLDLPSFDVTLPVVEAIEAAIVDTAVDEMNYSIDADELVDVVLTDSNVTNTEPENTVDEDDDIPESEIEQELEQKNAPSVSPLPWSKKVAGMFKKKRWRSNKDVDVSETSYTENDDITEVAANTTTRQVSLPESAVTDEKQAINPFAEEASGSKNNNVPSDQTSNPFADNSTNPFADEKEAYVSKTTNPFADSNNNISPVNGAKTHESIAISQNETPTSSNPFGNSDDAPLSSNPFEDSKDVSTASNPFDDGNETLEADSRAIETTAASLAATNDKESEEAKTSDDKQRLEAIDEDEPARGGPVDVDEWTEKFLTTLRKAGIKAAHQDLETVVPSDSDSEEENDFAANIPTMISSRFKEAKELSTTTEPEAFDTSDDVSLVRPLQALKELPQGGSEAMAVWSSVESKRRCWILQELKTLQAEWKCYKEFLQEIIAETDQAEALVRSSFESLEAYLEVMNPVLTDSFLDDHGREITNTRKQQQIIKKRQTKAKEVEINLIEDTSPLISLINHFYVLRNHLDEHIPSVTESVAEAGTLKKEVRWRAANAAQKLKEIGMAITEELEAAELRIQAAWDPMIEASMQGDAISKDKSDSTADRWLLENTYKSSVRLLLKQWKTRSNDMKNLYDSIFELDLWRRNRLQETLLSYLPKRRRLFLRIQQTLEPGVDALESGRMDVTQADVHLEDTVERLSRDCISKKNMHRSSIMNRSRSRQPTLDERFSADKIELNVEMLDSPHIINAVVVEAKLPDSGDWQYGVIICTMDQHLHTFVIPTGNGTDPLSFYTPPKQIMKSLPSDMISPSMSIHLPSCRIKLSSDVSYVDITPERTRRPMSLRFINSADTINFHDKYNKPRLVKIERV